MGTETPRSKTVQRTAAVPTRLPTRTPAAVASVSTNTKVSSPHDAAEREASLLAQTIMRMGTRKSAANNPRVGSVGVLRKGSQGEPEDRKVFRKEEGGGEKLNAAAADLIRGAGSGTPLPMGVRRVMEPRLRANFGNVTIHTSETSAKLNRMLSAKAFTVGRQIFFGEGRFQPDTDEGQELIAHELTHTLQGGGVAAGVDTAVVFRSSLWDAASKGVGQLVDAAGELFSLDAVLKFIGEKATALPGFEKFSLVIGKNPVTGTKVERTGVQVLQTIVTWMPFGDKVIKALENHNILARAGGWIDEKFAQFSDLVGEIKNALDVFISNRKLADVTNLGAVWEDAKRIFSEPIQKIKSFVGGLVGEILVFIKNIILIPIARLAEGTDGYDLLKAILRVDPITNEPVVPNAEMLVGGFMKLIGRQDVWENIKKAKAVERVWQWAQNAVGTLKGFVAQIPGLFVNAWNLLEIGDIFDLPTAFDKLRSVFGGFIGNFITWGRNAVWALLEILFAALAPGVLPYIKKAAGAFRTILNDPMRFVRNLINAGELGFTQFATNIGKHLQNALVNWLQGVLGQAGIYIPKSLDILEIAKFVLSVLGISWASIRQKLVKATNEKTVSYLETGANAAFRLVVAMKTGGVAALWEEMKTMVGDLRTIVVNKIKEFVTGQIVTTAVEKLISSLAGPAGAIIEAIKTTYKTITFIIDKMNEISQVVAAYIDSIAAIAAGAIGAAANKVETTLANMLTLAIGFLAKLLGLNKLGDKINEVLNRYIREPVSKALDKIILWIVNGVKKLAGQVGSAVRSVIAWWKIRKPIRTEDESHELYFQGEGASAQLWMNSYPMTLDKFLATKQGEAKNDEGKLLQQIQTKYNHVQKEQQAQGDRDTSDRQHKKIEALMNAIGVLIVDYLSKNSDKWGTESKPAPIEYPKRAASAYPVFYLNKKPGQPKEGQGLLEPNEERIRFSPLKSTVTPDGKKTLGLGPGSQVKVGMAFQFQGKGSRGNKVKEFKDTTKEFGFIPSAAGLDVDHVVELQIGGEDEFTNLWPLPLGENRSSGATIKAAKVLIPGRNDPMLLSDFLVKNKTWFFIKSTRQH